MDLEPAYVAAFAVATTFALLLLFMAVQRLLYPRPVTHDLQKGNVARRLMRVGQVLAVFMVSAAVVKEGLMGGDLLRDVAWVAAFGVVAVVLVSVTGRLGVQMLFSSRLPKELERGNVAAGVAAGANYVGTGIITTHAIIGHDLNALGLACVFFVLAQVTFHGFVALFRALTIYDDAEQIAGENLAAALSYAGLVIAVAIVVGHALDGDFTGWGASLRAYAKALIALVAFYPVRQLFVQMVLLRAPFALRGGVIDVAIGTQRDIGSGALEAVSYLATALAITELA